MNGDWYTDQLRNWWSKARKGTKHFKDCKTQEELDQAIERWITHGFKRFDNIVTQLEEEKWP